MVARDPFRPIMITSLTTLGGLLPRLTETSTQAQILIPLVASLAFGLLTATIASLFFVPAFFLCWMSGGCWNYKNELSSRCVNVLHLFLTKLAFTYKKAQRFSSQGLGTTLSKN